MYINLYYQDFCGGIFKKEFEFSASQKFDNSYLFCTILLNIWFFYAYKILKLCKTRVKCQNKWIFDNYTKSSTAEFSWVIKIPFGNIVLKARNSTHLQGTVLIKHRGWFPQSFYHKIGQINSPLKPRIRM